MDVLDLMKDHGWGQTHDTYTASLAACAAVGNAASAYEIWLAMRQATIVPNGTDAGLLFPPCAYKQGLNPSGIPLPWKFGIPWTKSKATLRTIVMTRIVVQKGHDG